MRRFYFKFKSAEVESADRDWATLLGPLLERTGAQAVTVYGLDRESEEFRALAAHSKESPRIAELGVTIGREATKRLHVSVAPFQASRFKYDPFSDMPEFLEYGIAHLALCPLRASDSLLGLMALGRTDNVPFDAETIQSMLPAARLASAVLEKEAVKRTLREGKLVESAKGLIRRRCGISEQDAYLILRTRSRRARRPMAELAREIIGNPASELCGQHIQRLN